MDPGRSGQDAAATGVIRLMMVPVSALGGSVPNAPPQSPPSRDAANASATAGSPYRASSDPCSTSAMSSARRRARTSAWPGSASSAFSRAMAASSRGSAPAAWPTSAKKASADSGWRCRTRSVSSAATLPEPSQMDCRGASRYSRGSPDSST